MKYILVRDRLIGEDGTIIKLDEEYLRLFWLRIIKLCRNVNLIFLCLGLSLASIKGIKGGGWDK